MKDCQSCPSYLGTSSEVIDRFGKSTGVPMCGRYGYALARPGQTPAQRKAVREMRAENCDAFLQARPPQLEKRDMAVMLPDPTVRMSENIDQVKKDSCSSCMMCSNFVPEMTVLTETGWTAGLCAAKGKLLQVNRLGREAQNCEFRQFGQNRSTTTGMQFLPEFNLNVTADGKPIKQPGEIIEPSEYETDKELTDDDREAGIRAWRRIDDPDGSDKFVHLPIYDPNHKRFSDDERAQVPQTGDDEHPELYLDHFGGVYGITVAWMELDETPCLWGQPGTGKTELYRHMAWLMQLPFIRISITKSTEIDDIAGKMLFSPTEGTHFQYGRLTKAWMKPCVLCVDEPNTGQPDVWQFIRPMTDNSKQLVIDQNESEAIERCLDCFPGMAMNPAWDPRNIGAMEIADADSNRLFHTAVPLPPRNLEEQMIKARVHLDGWEISADELDMVMKIAKDIRSLSDEEGLSITWAIRQQIKVARALRWFNPPTAYRRAVGDALDPEQLEILLDQVRAHWSDPKHEVTF